MISPLLAKILRIFFEHAVGVVLVILEKGELSVLFKQDLEEQLNEIGEDKEKIPLRKIPNWELLGDVIERFAVLKQQNLVLPAVDSDFEFIGLWNKQEIFRRFDKQLAPKSQIQLIVPSEISQAEKDALMTLGSSPEYFSETSENYLSASEIGLPEPAMNEFASKKEKGQAEIAEVTETDESEDDWHNAFAAIEHHENFEEAEEDPEYESGEKIADPLEDKSISQAETPPVKPIAKEPSVFAEKTIPSKRQNEQKPEPAVFSSEIRNKISDELEKSKLAVTTLETLPIPLLALKPNGEVLFMNLDWYAAKQQFSEELAETKLIVETKEMIGAKVLLGQLEIKKPLRMDIGSADFFLQIKPMQISESQNQNKKVTTVGYLFWLEKYRKHYRDQKEIQFTQIKKSLRPIENHATTGKSSFEGQTLPQILDETEKQALLWALEQANGNKSDAAMLLGIPRQTFTYKLQKFTRKRGNRG